MEQNIQPTLEKPKWYKRKKVIIALIVIISIILFIIRFIYNSFGRLTVVN
jgi:uncharacterized membrane protein YhdT